jgi:hypothetical protein
MDFEGGQIWRQEVNETAETVPETSQQAIDASMAFVCQARVAGGVCGATARHETNAHMCSRGHFQPGNQARRIHGVRGFETTGRLPDVLRQTVEEFRLAVIADRGGEAEMSTLDAAYIRRLTEAETVVRLIASDLAKRGLFTPRGRVRNTFSRWTEAMNLWDRLAQRIGTDRRARAVSLQDYLARAATVEESRDDG